MAFQNAVEKTVFHPQKKALSRTSKQIAVHSNVRPMAVTRLHYYKLLGLKPNATSQDIKTAYYNLAKKLHPDASKQESNRFQEIANAYSILLNEPNKIDYIDRNEIIKEDKGASGEPQKVIAIKAPILNVVCNNSSKKEISSADKMSIVKSDVSKLTVAEPVINVTFLQGILGTKKQCNVKYLRKCPKCNGTSKYGLQSLDQCRKCLGTGKMQISVGEIKIECDACKGNGNVSRHKCPTCDNRGFTTDVAKLQVVVPPNSNSGDIISVRNPVTNQKINIRLDVGKSDYFRRVGNDVYTDKYIKISEAVLGSKFTVRGIYEQLSFEAGPGIESHTIITLNGKGIRGKNGSAGKHIITLKIRIPQTLSPKQKQLILALARVEDPIIDGNVL